MTNESFLTTENISEIMEAVNFTYEPTKFARAIEQAVLQSPEVQRLRKDAERWRKAASHVFEIKQTHEPVGENRIRRLQIDLRRSSTSTTKWLNERIDLFGDAVAAMEKQP